ncbi:uncharacterized protein LOC144158060 [Haemaphysalis longicornis]
MSGYLNGVQAVIRETFPKALYVHCGAHSLNLTLLHSCQLASIRNCLGTVSSVCGFVKASPKRCNQLQDQVETEQQGRMSLISFCQTRACVIEVELMLWRKKWSKVPEADFPAGALGALSMCNAEFFSTIHRLFGILAMLPASTSTPERTFSTLRRLKNYLRNRVQQERLTGLALLSVHREVEVTPAQVLAEFCKL